MENWNKTNKTNTHLVAVISDVRDEVRHVMRHLSGWTTRQRNHTVPPGVPGIKRHVLQIKLKKGDGKGAIKPLLR